MMNRWLLVLLAVVLFSAFAFAQDAEDVPLGDGDIPEGEIPDGEMPEIEEEAPQGPRSNEAPGVTARAIFPSYSTNTFPAGESIDALIGIENAPENPNYRVEFVLAYMLTAEVSMYVQNFTGIVYNRSVTGGDTTSVKYRFKPDAMIDPRDYHLLLQVFYQNEDNDTFLSAAFNETITITDPLSTVDAGTTFLMVALAGAGAFYAYFKFGDSKKGSKKTRAQVEMGTEAQDIDWEYVSAEHIRFERERSASAGKSPKSQSPKRK